METIIVRYITKPVGMRWGIFPIHLDDNGREHVGNLVAEYDTRKQAWGPKQQLNRKAEKALRDLRNRT